MSPNLGGKPSATLQRFLYGVTFPAARESLIEGARKNQAPDEIMSLLNELPEGIYDGTQDVLRKVGVGRAAGR